MNPLNEKSFADQLKYIGGLYEGVKETLHLLNGQRMPIEDRKKHTVAYEQLRDLRDSACVHLRRRYINPDTAQFNDIKLHVHNADTHLNRAEFEFNRPMREQGEARLGVIDKSVRLAVNELLYGLGDISKEVYLENLNNLSAL